jgi:hypothetical protein
VDAENTKRTLEVILKSSGEYSRRPKPKTNVSAPARRCAACQTAGPEKDVQTRRYCAIQRSPRQVAQRRHLQRSFGRPNQQQPNKTGISDELKTDMEDHFNTDFSNVRVHTESSKAGEVGALAYTQGTEMYFAPGQFQPGTSRGKQLLGHELTHVVQQREGRVTPTGQIDGTLINNDPTLEKEADDEAAKIR